MPRHHLTILAIALCLAALVWAPDARAQDVPPFLQHQGRLLDALDVPISGPEVMTFRLYDSPDADATLLWEETQSVLLANGYYSATLGQTTALDAAMLDGSTRYLGVTVGDVPGGAEELAPRLEVSSVAYAIKAGVAENAVGNLTPTSIDVGGGTLTIASDGSINVGATTIQPDGTVTVGATTISPDGTISVGGASVIAADGSISADALSVAVGPGLSGDGSTANPLSLAETTLSQIEAAGCAQDQVPQYDVGSGWACATPANVDTDTTYEAGSGLTLTGPANTFSVDFGVAQQAIVNSCVAGEAIRIINADGTVTCEADDDTQYAAGAGIDITAGTISLIDATDDDTTYTAGSGLTLTGTVFDVDTAAIQGRVTGVCAAGSAVSAINADGTVSCEVDDDTTYAAGTGIDISGGTISLVDATDDDTTYSAGTGLMLSGTTFSLIDTTDDDTTYSAGTGLALSGTTFSLVDTTDDDTTYSAGTGLTLSGTTFDADTSVLQARVTGSCASGGVLTDINLDGTVSCAGDLSLTGRLSADAVATGSGGVEFGDGTIQSTAALGMNFAAARGDSGANVCQGASNTWVLAPYNNTVNITTTGGPLLILANKRQYKTGSCAQRGHIAVRIDGVQFGEAVGMGGSYECNAIANLSTVVPVAAGPHTIELWESADGGGVCSPGESDSLFVMELR